MISRIKTFGFALLLTFASTVMLKAQNVSEWKVDKAHTSVNFTVGHFFSTVTGKFKNFEGDFHLDINNLKDSAVAFTVAVNSIDTDNEKRDNHLESPDFFDSKTYPSIRFKSTKIEKVSDKKLLVYGALTIKDKTLDVALPLEIKGQMEHPMMKGTLILGLSTHLKINRNDYGVGTGDWAATMVIGDEVDINVYLELNRQK